jgi:hypothetical protein
VIGLTSFVIPVRNEAENIRPMLEALSAAIATPAEILIVYDEESDPDASGREVARCCAIFGISADSEHLRARAG